MPINFDGGTHMTVFVTMAAICRYLELVNFAIDTHRNKGVPQVMQANLGERFQILKFSDLVAPGLQFVEADGDFSRRRKSTSHHIVFASVHIIIGAWLRTKKVSLLLFDP